MSEVAEKTAEVVEESIDGVVDVIEVARNNPVALAAVGVLGLAVGGAVGYLVAKKQLKSFYSDLAEVEIAEAKAFYANLNKVDVDGAVLTPQSVMEQRHGPEAAAEALRIYRGGQAAQAAFEEPEGELPEGEPYDDVVDEAQIRKVEERAFKVVEEKEEVSNIFLDPKFDLAEELKYRTKTKPYIITHDEYFDSEKEYDTQSLVYFEVDDTLTNEKDEPIREIDQMVGEDHLVRFGHGSRDANIVYVRNDRLETDFEIVKSTGSYLEEVLGISDDDDNSLKHSDQRRAFRRGEG